MHVGKSSPEFGCDITIRESSFKKKGGMKAGWNEQLTSMAISSTLYTVKAVEKRLQ